MKKIVIALLMSASLVFILPFALADHHFRGNPPVSMSTVLGQLTKLGYYGFHEVEYDHGTYKVEAYNAQGQRVKLHYNPMKSSSLPSKSKQHTQQLTMLEAVQKAETVGYPNIYKVEFEHGRYEIKALNKNGSKVELYLDPRSGKISKDWFDD